MNDLLFRLKAEPKPVLCVIAAAVSLVLLILLPKGAKEREKDVVSPEVPVSYEQMIETKLCELVTSIYGVGDAVVMVTLESGEEQVYAHDTNEKASDTCIETESSLTVIETDDGDRAIVLKQIQPTIKGVAIVCEGANAVTVREAVVSAVSTVLGIPSSRVSISAMG